MKKRVVLYTIVAFLTVAAGALLAATWLGLRPMPEDLSLSRHEPLRHQWTDRHGMPLTITYANHWNLQDRIPLHHMPPLLVKAFILSEDRRFFQHGGVDWRARAMAVVQNMRAGRNVRGASTITEQVVRMVHPRPRTVWSRWVEGFEAMRFERRFSKHEILEFYLNQVPYGAQRRGIAQGARFYFGRDPNTLNDREMLILTILVRAPARLHQPERQERLRGAVLRLAGAIENDGEKLRGVTAPDFDTFFPPSGGLDAPIEASHFVRHVRTLLQADSAPTASSTPPTAFSETGDHRFSHGRHTAVNRGNSIQTTLDGSLQRRIQDILDNRLEALHGQTLENGAVLVVDHTNDHILAWVNGRPGGSREAHTWIDAVTVPRQPGSTLKPFLYALSFQKGWTAATLIDDAPLVEPVRWGLHPYRNYSRTHYGPLRIREALGNSLNIPAVKTLDFVGLEPFFALLRDLGFDSLTEQGAHYGRGLALGNGEVTLFELVRAYAVLARGGTRRPLKAMLHFTPEAPSPPRRIFCEETASLLAHILSDPQARAMEFSGANIFRFPVQTAVKTGTSNDHRDAWALGFNHRYTVGVWMGNLDAGPTRGITGTIGPGLVLRTVFAELNRQTPAAPLHMSPRLVRQSVCRVTGMPASPECPALDEYFLPETVPTQRCTRHGTPAATEVLLAGDGNPHAVSGPRQSWRLLQPTPGLLLARDPHIPDDWEMFAFRIPQSEGVRRVEWIVNGERVGETFRNTFHWLWRVDRGRHSVQAIIWLDGAETPEQTPPVLFTVQ